MSYHLDAVNAEFFYPQTAAEQAQDDPEWDASDDFDEDTEESDAGHEERTDPK